MTRRDQTYVLLRSLFDYLPPSPGHTALIVAKAGSRGPAPSKPGECKSCQGRGTVRSRASEAPCAACDGKGRVLVDPYIGEAINPKAVIPISDGESRDKRKRDAIRVDRMLRLDLDDTTKDPFDHAEQRRHELRRLGSYAELEAALRILRTEDGLAYLRISTWVVAGNEGDDAGPPWYRDSLVGPSLRESLNRTVDRLAELMPTPIRVPDWAHNVSPTVPGKGRWANGAMQERRNAEIRRLRTQGVTTTVLAKRYGLSVPTICAITNRGQ